MGFREIIDLCDGTQPNPTKNSENNQSQTLLIQFQPFVKVSE